jgi:hypothetical protein
MTYRFTSAANKEIEWALDFYERAENGLGGKFVDELSAAAIDRVLACPKRGNSFHLGHADVCFIGFRSGLFTKSEPKRF